MTHDPMCPMPDSRFMSATCQCDLIARVMEREQVAELRDDSSGE